ncbi:MAG: hypothetical protein GY895_07920 [Phycisphaera sp.]|nr:hypothetical protein [Phycisphaera sp.]
MTEDAASSNVADGEWWRNFKEALADEGLGRGEDRVDLSTVADGMNELFTRWFDAGPGRSIGERLESIDRRLARMEALLESRES